jgi:hypothetical protein
MKTLKDLFEVEDPKPEYELFCDMDGVLTNFDARFEHYAGMLPDKYEDKYGTAAFWELVDNKVGLKFWSEMPWTPGGKKLWDFIKPYNPKLLTSPSKNEVSRLGKNTWVKNNLNPQPKVIFKYSKEKQDYAHKNAIHIDDREDIIQNWNSAGGIGILCPKNGDTQVVIDKLKELGYK